MAKKIITICLLFILIFNYISCTHTVVSDFTPRLPHDATFLGEVKVSGWVWNSNWWSYLITWIPFVGTIIAPFIPKHFKIDDFARKAENMGADGVAGIEVRLKFHILNIVPIIGGFGSGYSITGQAFKYNSSSSITDSEDELVYEVGKDYVIVDGYVKTFNIKEVLTNSIIKLAEYQ